VGHGTKCPMSERGYIIVWIIYGTKLNSIGIYQ
jgi:hypothetical protein